jgi:ABC-type Fe3+ transport system permease subunit
MWRHRLRWYMQARARRGVKWNKGYSSRSPGLGLIALFFIMFVAGVTLLRSVWGIFMNGFLQATPWVQGSQVGTYYWNSASFALKSTLTIGFVMLLVMFLLGLQVSRLFRR